MDVLYLFLLIFFVSFTTVVSEMSLKFVFIIESHELDLLQQIPRALKAIEETKPEMRVGDDIIALDRENQAEAQRKLCGIVSQGVSMIFDLSWSPWEVAEQLAADTGVPLLRISLSSQQLVKAMDDYLETRNATDAAIILESESDVDRTLYTLLGTSRIRVWVHAGLTRDSARALKSMRPEPSFYVIVGETGFVMDTFRRVPRYLYEKLTWKQKRSNLRDRGALLVGPAYDKAATAGCFTVAASKASKEKLVRRNYRWNLVFTDYPTSFDTSDMAIPIMMLSADQMECCKLTGQKEECSCPTDSVQRKQLILQSLLTYVTEGYYKLEKELQTVEVKLDCDNPSFEMNGTRERLWRLFAEDAEMYNDSTFFWDQDSSSLLLRSRFKLSTFKPDEGVKNVAIWSADEEYKLLPGIELEPLKFFFRVGTAPAVPWTMPKLDPETGQQLYTENGEPIYIGYCIELIEKLGETMDFDFEIVTPKSGTFGQRLPNGTWDGIVGDLMRGETDLAVAALTMTAEREEVIDFVAPYFEQTGILIAIRKPVRKTSLFKFMTVLRTEVWLSIVGALVLTGLMIWLLDKYSPYSARNNPEAYPYPCREFTLKESFWFALTSFTPQGGGEAPKALSGRTLVAAYWLFVVLMLATFTANLAAFLTVERMQTPVSSLEQLARQSRINYTVVESSTVHQYFINMKFAEDTLYRVWKEITLNATSDQAQYRVWDYPIREQYGHILLAINASGPVPDAKTGFQQVNDHVDADFAFIHDSAEIRYEVTRNCNLTEVGDIFAEQPYAIAVQQGSRLQEDLSKALLELQKERFLEQLGNKYWNETARQSCPDADESEGITLESLGGVFIATLFGLGLAMITLAWEVFYYKRKEKTKVQTIDNVKRQAFVETIEKKGIDGVARLRKKGRKTGNTKNVTIGDTFKPVSEKVSYISIFPKDGGYNP